MSDKTTAIETAIRERYAIASRQHEPCLCVPSQGYEQQYLQVLPEEIIQRDYGCGDPSRWIRSGETVLDLGSGGGKACYICAQKVGASGQVIGVDFNQPMLELARRYQRDIGEKIGYHNTSFRKGKIQDLKLDLDLFENWLTAHPVSTADDFLKAQDHADHLRRTAPLVVNDSVDVIVSNCVLNLVRNQEKKHLFAEMFRVLKRGGRCVIADIVSDEDVPQALQDDHELWSGCVSGAFREDLLLAAFEEAGFHGIQILERSSEPWQTIHGIEFRSVTVAAYKGKDGPCIDHNQAVIYKGPWKRVIDDDGHTLDRGKRMAVCAKTFNLYQQEPYKDQFHAVEPMEPVDAQSAAPFNCRANAVRDPRQTKGATYDLTTAPKGGCCGPEGCC